MYIQIEFSTLEEPLMDASDEQLGTWVRVCKYCFGQSNGGRIKGFASLDELQVTKRTDTTIDSIKEAHPYLYMDGEDLIVLAYPQDREDELRKKSAGGKKAQQNRRETKDTSEHSSKDSSEQSTERKIEERKRERDDFTLSFLAEYFIGCHPACSACNHMAVENILRGEDHELVKEAIDDFSKQWAGSDFPASAPPLKEFSKYLRNSERFHKKKKNGAPAVDLDRPQRFEGRSANDP